MKCPFCGEENTKVIDSRPADDNSSIRRRRKCEKCGKRFTTYEKLETIPLVIIKKDEAREPYDRSKIERGVFRSCIKRPISVDQINIKATTEEGLGFTGTGEGISAQAVCALIPIANYAYEDVMQSSCEGCQGCNR